MLHVVFVVLCCYAVKLLTNVLTPKLYYNHIVILSCCETDTMIERKDCCAVTLTYPDCRDISF